MFPLTFAVALLTSFYVADGCPYLSGLISGEGEKDKERILTNRYRLRNHFDGFARGSTCNGRKKFCYGRISDNVLSPPFDASFSDLATIASPNDDAALFNYMEDSQERRDTLEGFRLDNEDPEKGAAGYTYIAQFLSHDLNLDETSILGDYVDPNTLPNTNTAFMDLDTLYDFDGKKADLVDGKFVIGVTPGANLPRDFPRDLITGRALTLDLRNDEHRIVSQIAVAFMCLHNKFYDGICNESPTPVPPPFRFSCAKRETIKAWQSVVLTDLLPNLIDENVLTETLDVSNRKLYVGQIKKNLLMPAEFSFGVMRLFHSRARGRYRMNNVTDDVNGPRARLFDVGREEPILLGGSPLPDNLVIEWDRFFGPNATITGGNRARIMDMLYSRPIHRLPIAEAGTPEEIITIQCTDETNCPIVVNGTVVDGNVVASLAVLDLCRSRTVGLPGGISFANYVKNLGVPDITIYSMENMTDGNVFGLPASYNYSDVPLLLYLAHESIFEHQGIVLGNLGSRMVSETLYGLVEESPISILKGGNFDYISPITGSGHELDFLDVLRYIGWI